MKRFYLILFCSLIYAATSVNAQTPEEIAEHGPVKNTYNSGNIRGNLHQDGTLIVFPSGTTGQIPNNYCNGNSSVITLIVKEGITLMDNNAFRNCNNLTTIIICSTMLTINNNVLGGCDNLKTFIIYAMNAPALGNSSNTFPNADGFELIIPDGATGYDQGNWAQYTRWNVKFDYQNGRDPIYQLPDKILTNKTIAKPEPDPTHPVGYAFGGWYREPGCVNEWDFTRDLVRGNLTLFAQWVIPVEGVELDIKSVTLPIGDRESLTATVYPSNATNKNLLWSSSNTAIAAVNAAGVVTAVGVGVTTIAVATVDGNFTDECEVTVTPIVTGVIVLPSTTTVQIGATQHFTALVSEHGGANTDVTWTVTGNNSLLTAIDEVSGLLTIDVEETAETITVTATSTFDSSKKGTATVHITDETVLPEVLNITVLPSPATVEKGAIVQFTADVEVQGDASAEITWTITGNISAGTGIDEHGILTVATDETAESLTVRATSVYDGTTAGSVTMDVVDPPAVISITVLPSITDVTKGTTQQFTATVSVQGGASDEVIWTVMPATFYSSMNQSGLLTVGAGETTETLIITATSVFDETKKGTATVTVPVHVIGVSLNKSSTTITVGKTEQLTAIFEPSYATNKNVSWTSTNESIATVSGGLVTGISEGTATITVTTVDGGKTAQCIVTVMPITYDITASVTGGNGSISPSGTTTVNHGEDQQYTITPDTGYHIDEVLIDGTNDPDAVSSGIYQFTNVTENHTIVVSFAINTYTIAVSADPIEGGAVSGGNTYAHGNDVTVTALADEGYTFLSWQEEGGSVVSTESSYSFPANKDINLIAHFQENDKYALIFEIIPEHSGSVTGNGQYYEGNEVSIIAYPNENYEFAALMDGETELTAITPYTYTMPAENKTLTAVFRGVEMIITATANPVAGGTISGAGTYRYGKDAIVTAITNAGYEFVNWTDENDEVISTNTSYTFTVSENVAFTANFELIPVITPTTYTVTVLSDGTDASGAGDYEETEIVHIDAGTPPSGQQFVNWTASPDVEFENPNSATTFFNMPASAVTVTANFEPVPFFTPASYTVTVLSEGKDASGSGDYEEAEIVNIDAGTPPSGQQFVNWTASPDVEFDDPNSATTFFNMPASAVTVTANFEPIPEITTTTYKVNVAVNNSDYGSATGNGFYDEDDTVTVTATAFHGYIFVSWTKDGIVISSENTYSFTAAENVDLVANFEAIIAVPLLDFDTYVATKWNNTFLLNLNRLKTDGYEITGCTWYKNNIIIGEGLSYSAGPGKEAQLEAGVSYFFVLSTGNHEDLRSTDKIINNLKTAVTILVYPNPVQSGSMLTIEGVTEGAPITVYNQSGVCVSHTIATGSPAMIHLQVPAGLYVIRTANGEAKIIIEN